MKYYFHTRSTRPGFHFLRKIKNPNPSPIGKRFGFCVCGAPPGTRTLGPLIKRNQEAIFIQINFYEDSPFYTYHRDFLGRFSLHPLHCLHPFASIIQLFNVQNMCRNVQRTSRLENAGFLLFCGLSISCVFNYQKFNPIHASMIHH